MDADDRRHHPHHTSDPGRITVNLAATDDDDDGQNQNHGCSSKHPAGGAVGREDCWSDGATSILIDAWGDRYLALSRGNLKQKHWKEVADIVCASLEEQGQVPKTDMQCKNRIDTVKKKYKLEKSKMLAGGTPSRWPLFQKLDHLIGPAPKDPTPLTTVLPPVATRSSYKMQIPPAPADSDSTGSLPEENYAKRRRMNKEMDVKNHLISKAKLNSQGKMGQQGTRFGGAEKKLGMSSMGDLTEAILNLGQAYEQAENAKLKQLMEIEKHRMKFAKELELKRMQMFIKTQVEISQIKEAAIRWRAGKIP